ncbi:MAG TPA: hypothetical protein PLJ35_15335 [Anaerolineae bacterium]|nr:hypothetical protein [Anaerolineae bacterium]HPL30558.1 hypothetical protein [Anaerolineae bacterium]
MTTRRTRIVAIVLLATLVLPLLAGCGAPAGKPAAEPTKVAPASAGEPAAPARHSSVGNAQSRASEALGLVVHTSGETHVFPSYHIEVKGSGPALDWETQEVETEVIDLKADVQGENVHLFYAGSDGEMIEGYIIDDGEDQVEYEVIDGTPQETFGLNLTWVTWPLGVITPYSLAAMGAQPAGSEAIDGRQAEVYDVDMAKGDQTAVATVKGMLGSMTGQDFTAAKGKAWVDQETGALLKLALDYEEVLYDRNSEDKDAPPVGRGSGHYEILVTQVGKVSVSLP